MTQPKSIFSFSALTQKSVVVSLLVITFGIITVWATPPKLVHSQKSKVRKLVTAKATESKKRPNKDCDQVVKADVVALEQPYFYNRFGSFNPDGLMFALREDVVDKDGKLLKVDCGSNGCAEDENYVGTAKLRSDKRPRPLVLRVNEGDCLQVTFTNLLSSTPPSGEASIEEIDKSKTGQRPVEMSDVPISQDALATRYASMHVNGLEYVTANGINSDGTNVGINTLSMVKPGATTVYTWYGKKQGGFFFHSMGAPVGGEGNGGQLDLGLFGSINVQPKGSKWYRSQVTHNQMKQLYQREGKEYRDKSTGLPLLSCRYLLPDGKEDTAKIKACQAQMKANFNGNDYYDTFDQGRKDRKIPVLNILSKENKIVHSDLNAIIVYPRDNDHMGSDGRWKPCKTGDSATRCNNPYREFTVIFHDELKGQQAFAALEDEAFPPSYLREGMGINYGSSGIGAPVLANRMRIGAGADCEECKLEEFFLSSWVQGDPAMLVKRDAQGKVSENLYQDDPSNVHHSYLGDQVRFVNMHAGPKETHVFHLHAQQWEQDKEMSNSAVLDSQTISPGATFSYDILNGGAGNLNHTVGDSIFHCHLYPHFAQGMWELWRTHDTFEDGTQKNFFTAVNSGDVNPCGKFKADGSFEPCGRNLPDKEIQDGTLTPALVPLPLIALPPMPSDKFGGYPFYIPAMAGHRPPQPPNDMECNDPGWKPWDKNGNPQACQDENNGGLPRHIIAKAEAVDYLAFTPGQDAAKRDLYQKEIEEGFLSHPKCSVEDEKLGKCISKCTPEKRAQGLCDLFDLGISTNIEIAERVSSVNTNKNNHFSLARKLEKGQFVFLNPLGDSHTNKSYQGWAAKAMQREQIAMKVHANRWNPITQTDVPGESASADVPATATPKSEGYESADHTGKHEHEFGKLTAPANSKKTIEKNIFAVNGRDPMPGAPYADPCPDWVKTGVDENGKEKVERVDTRVYRGAYVQFDLTVNKYGWHDPQARIAVLEEDVADTISGQRPAEPLFFRAKSGECIEFRATNLVPSTLNLDDFQIFSATDTIGQHIHLVKFDVTSSDGSANGWNYEDGTFSPDEVRERLHAHNEQVKADGEPENSSRMMKPKMHPMFSTTKTERHFGSYFNSLRSRNGQPKIELRAECDPEKWWTIEAAKKNPWCGAQTTVQRWFADPMFNRENHDRTLRSVFTHDHFGPSSHQQHGLYAALVIEPREAQWQSLDGKMIYGAKNRRNDGGPTSFAANIIFNELVKKVKTPPTKSTVAAKAKSAKPTNNPSELEEHDEEYEQSFREYNLAFADFAIVYTSSNNPVNAPNRIAADLPRAVEHALIPKPEAISAEDPGTQVLNYRNEPIPLRIANMKGKKDGDILAQKTIADISDACRREVTIEPMEKYQGKDRSLGVPRCAASDESCIQRLCNPGDMANVFSSLTHQVKPENDSLKNSYPTCGEGKRLSTEDLKYGKTCGEPFQMLKVRQAGKVEEIPTSVRQPGDPGTPLLTAYANDRVQIRLVQGAQEEQHIFSMHGVKWLSQPDAHGSGYMNGQHIGISEHFEAQINPGTSPIPIDHFYSSSTVDNLWDGLWGILRVLPANKNFNQTGLARLPNNNAFPVRTPDANWFGYPSNPVRWEKVMDFRRYKTPYDWAKAALAPGSTFVDDPTNPCDGEDAKKMPLRIFDVHALPGEKLPGGQLTYNEKFGLADPNAIVFVKSAEYYRANVSNEYDPDDKRVRKLLSGTTLESKIGKHLLEGEGETLLVEFDGQLNTTRERRKIEPLILRARAGECIEVRLTNDLPSDVKDGPDFPNSWSWNQVPAIVENFNFNQFKMSNRVSLHPQLLAFKPLFHDGSNVGLNFDSTVAPGEMKAYKWYAGDRKLFYESDEKGELTYEVGYEHTPMEFGAISLSDWGDPIKHSSHGAIGALIIEPEDARHPSSEDKELPPIVRARYKNLKYLAREDKVKVLTTDGIKEVMSAASATILTGGKPFKEFVLLYQDDVSFKQNGDPVFNLSNEEDSEDTGGKAFNYRTEPLWARMGVGSGAAFEGLRGVDQSSIFSNWEFCQDGSKPKAGICTDESKVLGYGPPATPMFTAIAGDAVRFRIVQPSGHPRQHTFTVYGHSWPESPWNIGEPVTVSSRDNYDIQGSYKLIDKAKFFPDGKPLNGAIPEGVITGAVNGIGPMRHFNILTTAGGKFNVPGQYMYRTIDSFNLSGGLWGIFDVQPLEVTKKPNLSAGKISKYKPVKRIK